MIESLLQRSVYVLFYRCGDHRDLPVLQHSFPTRRSSDLLELGRDGGTRAGIDSALCYQRHDRGLEPAEADIEVAARQHWPRQLEAARRAVLGDRKSTRLNSSP